MILYHDSNIQVQSTHLLKNGPLILTGNSTSQLILAHEKWAEKTEKN